MSSLMTIFGCVLTEKLRVSTLLEDINAERRRLALYTTYTINAIPRARATLDNTAPGNARNASSSKGKPPSTAARMRMRMIQNQRPRFRRGCPDVLEVYW